MCLTYMDKGSKLLLCLNNIHLGLLSPIRLHILHTFYSVEDLI